MTPDEHRYSDFRPAGNHAAPRQAGYALVELLIVITITAIVFSTVALTLHLLQRVNHQVRSELPRSEAMMRLTLRLRADAHDSNRFLIEAGPDGVPTGRFIQPAGVHVVYHQQKSVVVRRVLRNDQAVHQESYRCADRAETAWVTDRESPSIVTFLVKRSKSQVASSSDSSRVDRIDAALGLAVGTQP